MLLVGTIRSGGSAQWMLSAATDAQVSGTEQFTWSNGLYGLVQEKGVVEQTEEGLLLSQGSVIVTGNGILSIETDSLQVRGIDSTFYIRRGEDNVSVAVLHGAAVVQKGDRYMVVPEGMQWEFSGHMAAIDDGAEMWIASRTPAPLPLNFRERTQSQLASVRKPETTLPAGRGTLPRDLFPEETLLLPASAKRSAEEKTEDILGTIRTAVEDTDHQRLNALLAQDIVQEALHTPRGLAVVAILLADTPETETGIRMQLMQILASDNALLLAASLHPHYRTIAWAMTDAESSTEQKLVRTFLFPFSLRTQEPFTAFEAERFSSALAETPHTAIDAMLPAMTELTGTLEQLGYPQKSRMLADILQSRIAHEQTPTAAMQLALQYIHMKQSIDIRQLPPVQKEVSAPAPEQPAVSLSALQIEEKTRAMLQRSGALFTVQSTIAATGTNSARISDVLFASPAGDRSVSFTLNLLTDTVSDIDTGEAAHFPYQPAFDGFVEWIRQ